MLAKRLPNQSLDSIAPGGKFAMLLADCQAKSAGFARTAGSRSVQHCEVLVPASAGVPEHAAECSSIR